MVMVVGENRARRSGGTNSSGTGRPTGKHKANAQPSAGLLTHYVIITTGFPVSFVVGFLVRVGVFWNDRYSFSLLFFFERVVEFLFNWKGTKEVVIKLLM